MSEIPEDIRRASHIAVTRFETRIQSGEFSDPDGTEAREALLAEFQSAILAERERCAEVARRFAVANLDHDGEATDASSVAQVICNTIRSPTHISKETEK